MCTETFLVVGPFNKEEDMNSCSIYMKTCFFRFLLFLGHGTMQVNQNVFCLIPLQNFTVDSDIDWSQSVAVIDQQLYRKYGLEAKEIAFIEEKIRATE